MKLRTTRPRNGLRAPTLLTIGVVWVSSSCSTTREAPELTQAASQVPALAAMIDEARSAPPERVESGTMVRSIRGAEIGDPDGWSEAAREVSIVIEEGRLAVRSARHQVDIGARRLGPTLARATVQGSAVLQRDASGAVQAAMLARPYGVEDLLFQHEESAVVGYELELPRGWSLKQPAGFPGLVEIRDSRGRPRLRIVASVAWDADGRTLPVTARLDGRRVIFSVPDDAEMPVVIDPEWQDTGSPAKVRARSTATVLQDGKLLVVGGLSGSDDVLSATAEVLCTTEIYDPLDLTWEAGPPVQTADGTCVPLMDHVAVPLPDGSVLVVGGANREALVGADQPAAVATAFRFDPKTRGFSPTGSMSTARVHHTGTLLPSGQVLVTGGSDRQTPLHETRSFCPEVNGEVCQRCVGQGSAELYDSTTGTFTAIDMPTPRACHTATLLGDGSVLLIGGGGVALDLSLGRTGEAVGGLTLFRDGAFGELTTRLNSPRFGHVAVHRPDTDQILVAFGRDQVNMVGPKTNDVLAELVDVGAILSDEPPATALALPCGEGEGGSGSGGAEGGAGGSGGAFGNAGSGGSGGAGEPPPMGPCPIPRSYAAAVLAHTGKAFIAGGQEFKQNGTGSKATVAVDAFDFDTLTFDAPAPPQLPSPASKPVLSLLPTGKILLVGQTAPAEFFDDTEWRFVVNGEAPALAEPRSWHTATPLPDGTLFVAGGFSGIPEGEIATRATAEIFDPIAGTSTLVPTPMLSRRQYHTATFLPASGTRGAQVLLVGGVTSRTYELPDTVTTETAELYDLASQTFVSTGSMGHRRALHVAVRLPTGKVLVAGGIGDGNGVLEPSAELYDPDTGEFTPLEAPTAPRIHHTATLLWSGNVLLTGGFAAWAPQFDPHEELTSAEIFDRETQTFRPLVGMVIPRGFHNATALPDGQVLITGGSDVSSTAELFDPESETFRLTAGAMTSPRLGQAAVVLPSGKVMISGGAIRDFGEDPMDNAEIYDPASESFDLVAPDPEAAQPRGTHTAALLVDGRVALLGGTVDSSWGATTTSISYLSSTGTLVAPDAAVVSGPDNASPGSAYPVEGLALSSYWETSSGPYASPTGAPIAVWVPSTGAPVLGTFAPWSEGAATWTPPSTPFAGDGVLFAARHGQSSVGISVQVGLAPNGVACISDVACESGFCSEGVCCNERCHVAGDAEASCVTCLAALGAEADGVCSAVPEDEDPHEDCTQAPECAAKFAVCGGDGECKECRCASKLDCSDGYICTASGSCELPPRVKEADGCAVRPEPGSGDPHAPLFAVVALLLAGVARRGSAAARRTSHTAADARLSRVDTQGCRAFRRAGGCLPSNPLRVDVCSASRAGSSSPVETTDC